MLRSTFRTFWGAVSGLLRLPGMQTPLPQSQMPTAAPVNFDLALSVSQWWAGVRLLAEVIASLPICFYYNGKENDIHPLWYLLNVKPNRYMNRVEFFECVILNLVTSGNAYILVERLGDRIVSLLPVMSSQMEVELLDGNVIYIYYDGAGNRKVFAPQSVWHIRLFGNGIIGLSPLGHARNALGVAIAAENRVGAVYRNGGKPTGILMIDKVLNKEQRAKVRENMKELAEGNADNLFVLEAGMKYQQVSLNPEDLELISTRRMQGEDILRFLGVPSVLVNDTQGSTVWGSGIAQIIDGFQKLNLRPYFKRIELGIKVSLFTVGEARAWSVKYDFDELTQMNMAERFEALGKGINGGHLTPNEARVMEGRDPVKGGDQLLVNGTLVPIDMVRAKPQTQEIPNARNQAARD